MFGCLIRTVKSLPDRFVVALSMILHQRLEESHSEDFTFALINAGCQVFMDIIPKQMPVQECPAAVSFHEQFDSGFLLCLTGEDLGDDTFQFPAEPRIQQTAAPFRQRIATDNQCGQATDAPDA